MTQKPSFCELCGSWICKIRKETNRYSRSQVDFSLTDYPTFWSIVDQSDDDLPRVEIRGFKKGSYIGHRILKPQLATWLVYVTMFTGMTAYLTSIDLGWEESEQAANLFSC